MRSRTKASRSNSALPRVFHRTRREPVGVCATQLWDRGKRYMSLVLQPVIDALSACERTLLGDSKYGARPLRCRLPGRVP
ncbi:hypothetical protein [Streptomyces sp. NPDC005969]|uniref:hypothetical protein n=1 Tax=Streptomyces sp. NPDC005969 TaxID=3156722 RepID=UPI0033EFB581